MCLSEHLWGHSRNGAGKAPPSAFILPQPFSNCKVRPCCTWCCPEAEGKPTEWVMVLLQVGVASEHGSTWWKTDLILGDGEGG